MSKFIILLDSTADISEETYREYDIAFLPSHLIVDGKETDAPICWDTITRDNFYTTLKSDPEKYKTAPPSVGEMANKMEEYVSAGIPVIYLCISGGMSGTYGFAMQAKKILLEKYPDAVIECVDTLRFGPAIGLMAIHASELRAAGKSFDEVVAYINENKNRYHQAGWLDDLSFIAKKGRLTHAKAFFGTLAGIKPIGEFDYNGMTTVLGKAKGEKKAFEVLIKYMKETINDPETQTIFVAQSNRLPQAEKYKVMIEEQFHPKAVIIKDIYPACGTNVGPGLMAAYYVGNPISDNLDTEREIIKNAIEG